MTANRTFRAVYHLIELGEIEPVVFQDEPENF